MQKLSGLYDIHMEISCAAEVPLSEIFSSIETAMEAFGGLLKEITLKGIEITSEFPDLSICTTDGNV